MKINNACNEQVAILMRSSGRATLLGRALRSVMAQTTSDWTLYLMFDSHLNRDCSTILQYFQSEMGSHLVTLFKDQRHASGSLESSLIELVDHSNCHFVTVHNESDTWDPSFLEKSVGRFRREPQLAAVASLFKCVQESVHHNGLFVKGDEDATSVKEVVLNAMNTNAGQNVPPLAFIVRLPYLRSCGHYSDLLSMYGQLEWQRHLISVGDVLVQGGAMLATKHHCNPDLEGTGTAVSAGMPADIDKLIILETVSEPQQPQESSKPSYEELQAELERTKAELSTQAARPWFSRLFNKEK